MKKLLLIVAVVLLLCAGFGGIYWGVGRLRDALGPGGRELRASQQDEDAAPPSEPSLSVQVNGQSEVTLVAGGPLYVTIAASGRNAVNIESKLVLLRARVARLSKQAQRSTADEQALVRTRTSIAALEAAARLTLGEAARPWTEALRVNLRNLTRGPAGHWELRVLAPASGAGPVVLDAASAVEVHMVPEQATLEPGRYEVQACLGATGTWKGTACSAPLLMAVEAHREALTGAQRDALDAQAARLALLAGQWEELERLGQALLARDKVAGHTALGDAHYGQQHWQQSLEHYTAARAALPRGKGEPPQVLTRRISFLLEKLDTEP